MIPGPGQQWTLKDRSQFHAALVRALGIKLPPRPNQTVLSNAASKTAGQKAANFGTTIKKTTPTSFDWAFLMGGEYGSPMAIRPEAAIEGEFIVPGKTSLLSDYFVEAAFKKTVKVEKTEYFQKLSSIGAPRACSTLHVKSDLNSRAKKKRHTIEVFPDFRLGKDITTKREKFNELTQLNAIDEMFMDTSCNCENDFDTGNLVQATLNRRQQCIEHGRYYFPYEIIQLDLLNDGSRRDMSAVIKIPLIDAAGNEGFIIVVTGVEDKVKTTERRVSVVYCESDETEAVLIPYPMTEDLIDFNTFIRSILGKSTQIVNSAIPAFSKDKHAPYLLTSRIILNESIPNGDGDVMPAIGRALLNWTCPEYIRDALRTTIRVFMTDMGVMRPEFDNDGSIAGHLSSYLICIHLIPGKHKVILSQWTMDEIAQMAVVLLERGSTAFTSLDMFVTADIHFLQENLLNGIERELGGGVAEAFHTLSQLATVNGFDDINELLKVHAPQLKQLESSRADLEDQFPELEDEAMNVMEHHTLENTLLGSLKLSQLNKEQQQKIEQLQKLAKENYQKRMDEIKKNRRSPVKTRSKQLELSSSASPKRSLNMENDQLSADNDSECSAIPKGTVDLECSSQTSSVSGKDDDTQSQCRRSKRRREQP